MNVSDIDVSMFDGVVETKKIYEHFRQFKFSDAKIRKIINEKAQKISRGFYRFDNIVPMPQHPPVASVPSPKMEKAPVSNAVQSILSEFNPEVPNKDKTYVAFGNHSDIENIVRSSMFYPVYVAGNSGNGKTFMVEQICAKLKRTYIRVQISPETDEDALIGGFRLVNGETVFQKGPVIKAMETGSILLIDEIDRGTNKIMALQGVLEGKPVLIKKTGETVKPAPGFNVIATGNTLGRGSLDGKYNAATILDDAFLERFVIAIHQTYPTKATEKKILTNNMNLYRPANDDDIVFIDKLTTWANVIRKTYEDDAVDDEISTRRLTHIIKTYSIFNDRLKSIELCINRYDDETKEAFLDLYTKVDEGAIRSEEDDVPEVVEATQDSGEFASAPF